MTNEEAVRILRRIQEPEAWEPQINGAAFEALDMAIEALGQKQAAGSKDLISRSSLLAKYDEQHEGPPGRARKLIEDEPPAQPGIICVAKILLDKEQTQETVKRAVEELRATIHDGPRKGQWHYSNGKPATIGRSFGVICDQCGKESEYCTNFCGECGADMRGVQDGTG